ncbi:hypothetical protein PM082_018218 [Marasmius tenuissimus]|nr:hypothetical protein PM082_018218 [Marasmius tenuissimus]
MFLESQLTWTEGVELANLAVTSDTKGASQQIHEQAPTTPGHQNDELEEGSQARAPEPDLSSDDPNVDNAAGGNDNGDARENGARADLTYRLSTEVKEYKRSLELALQAGAVSTTLIATISATILQTYRSDDWGSKDGHFSRSDVALDIFSFASIIMNVTGALKALAIFHKLSEPDPRRALDDFKSHLQKYGWLPRVPDGMGRRFATLELDLFMCESQCI